MEKVIERVFEFHGYGRLSLWVSIPNRCESKSLLGKYAIVFLWAAVSLAQLSFT
jgi:hypothetical protein